MAQNSISKYLAANYIQNLKEKPPVKKGMVITISRDSGCNGESLVEFLIKLLNKKAKQNKEKSKWRSISKEALEKAAEKLNMHPDKVTRLLDAQNRNMFEEMLLSLSGENYPSDIKIKNTIKSVIVSLANQGHVIILGRAGVSLLKGSKKTLHVKLTAPLSWRIEQTMAAQGLSKAKATKFMEQADNERQALKAFYNGKPITYSDYDLIFNVSSLSQKEIAGSILKLILSRS